jgi:hypothetical protein
VNLLAGAGRYRLRVFLLFSILGRMIWTSTYLGLGYGFGVAIEAAADFPSSLSGFLASLAVLAGLGFMLPKSRAHPNRSVLASYWTWMTRKTRRLGRRARHLQVSFLQAKAIVTMFDPNLVNL